VVNCGLIIYISWNRRRINSKCWLSYNDKVGCWFLFLLLWQCIG